MEFLDVIRNRHSVRTFLSKEIEQEKLDKILEVVNRAPSAGNLQAYEIVAVRDKQKKRNLANAALGQDFIAQAPVVLIFLANPQTSSQTYGDRGRSLYCIQDATIAAAYSQLVAVDLGLASCWVGAFNDEKVKEILNAPAHLKPIAVIPIGYSAEKPISSPRKNLDDIVHRENF